MTCLNVIAVIFCLGQRKVVLVLELSFKAGLVFLTLIDLSQKSCFQLLVVLFTNVDEEDDIFGTVSGIFLMFDS